jgi:hypothetical protein
MKWKTMKKWKNNYTHEMNAMVKDPAQFQRNVTWNN